MSKRNEPPTKRVASVLFRPLRRQASAITVGRSRFWKGAAAIACLSLLSLVLASFAQNVEENASPNPDYLDALWTGAAQELVKIDAADAALLFQAPAGHGVEAVAIDERRGRRLVLRR